MLIRHTVTLHHIIKVYNDMFNRIDAVMRSLAKKKIQWKGDLFFSAKLAWQKPSKYYAEMTQTSGMLDFSAHILNPFLNL